MDHALHRAFRTTVRLLWLTGELLLALVSFAALALRHAGIPDRELRACWLQRVCRRLLRVFSIGLRISGPVPSTGMLVCNHLSYLDIVLIGATTPCIFVSKSEVKRWPLFGWIASLAGTLFVHRNKHSDLARITREMSQVLDAGSLLVLFPEGTTSDGSEVLPFKSSLFEPATRRPQGLSVGFIAYALNDGSVPDEVCYWRDMTLVPHLINLLGKRGLEARLCFTDIQQHSPDRKLITRQLHSEIVRLKEAFSV